MNDSISKVKSDFHAACQDPQKIAGSILAVVDRNGTLLLHESAGLRQVGSSEPMNKDGLCWMASCTKMITAIACLQLVEQGKLKMDEPIATILPEISPLEASYKTKTTLKHLLTHTAGQTYPFFNRATHEWFEEKGMTSFGCARQSLMAPLQAEPGTKWEYGSAIDWVGQAVEKVSGLSLDGYFKKFIFEPLGISNMTLAPETGVKGGVKKTLAGMNFKAKDGKVTPMEHVIELDESKVEVQYGGAGAYGNAAEYVQILATLLNKGTHPVTKKQILKPESVEELMKDQLEENLTAGLYEEIADAQPEITNSFKILEGVPKNWSYGGLKIPGLLWWAGK
ncbi:hypothetical protein CBS101457_001496 [Exobasidium rhododendri]|nr:hypothetical protein CBS101457_001496 [Exobasidium rhododendri]